MARRSGRASPSRLRAAQRERISVEMREKGHTFAEIAKKLGYANEAGARKAVYRSLEDYRAATRESVEVAVQLELNRLDGMTWALNQREDKDNPRVVLAQLRIMERRAKLLGLDATRRSSDFESAGWAVPTESAAEVSRRLIERIEAIRTQRDTEPTAGRVNPTVGG